MLNKIICGDCLEVMPSIPDNSIDSIVTDPPYAGSGSTLVASMLEGFNFVGIELEAAHVDIANQRIAERQVALW